MISSPPSRTFLLAALVCGMLFLATGTAHAQKEQAVSSAEDVAIAFFKAGASNPDFDSWAKASRDYKTAAPTRAEEALFNEKQRLFKKWRAYNPDENVLTVAGSVQVELKAITTKDGNDQYWMYMSFPHGDVTYFPYKFLDYEFALIPQQIETMMIQPLQKEQYEHFLHSFNGTKSRDALLSVQLKPVRAYMQQPYMIDNKEQWVLLCDVATMALSTAKTGHPVWTYGADWYVSPVTQELRDLFQEPTETPLQ